MQNNARVGGILSIISGAFGVFWLIGTVFMIIMMSFAFNEPYMHYGEPAFNGTFTVIMAVYAVTGGFFTLLGVLAVVGGIFALRKKVWGLALAGSIAGTIIFLPCGVPAIIFTAIGKPEFEVQDKAG